MRDSSCIKESRTSGFPICRFEASLPRGHEGLFFVNLQRDTYRWLGAPRISDETRHRPIATTPTSSKALILTLFFRQGRFLRCRASFTRRENALGVGTGPRRAFKTRSCFVTEHQSRPAVKRLTRLRYATQGAT